MKHVFLTLMLQKPSRESKAKKHAEYLQTLLAWWQNGKLDKLMSQCKETQNHIKIPAERKENENRKAHCRFMLQGKVSKAIRFIDHDENSTTGVLPLTEEVLKQLKAKHPETGPIDPNFL